MFTFECDSSPFINLSQGFYFVSLMDYINQVCLSFCFSYSLLQVSERYSIPSATQSKNLGVILESSLPLIPPIQTISSLLISTRYEVYLEVILALH